MKQEVSPAMLIAVVVAVVLIIGVIGWMNLAPRGDGSASNNQLQTIKATKRKNEGD